MNNCPVCSEPMPYAAGIGPFCASKSCPVSDDADLWSQADDGQWSRPPSRVVFKTGYDAATVAACAKVADEFAGSAKVAEARSLQASSVAESISRREVEMEYAVGYAKSGSMASGIAARIRALPIAPPAPLQVTEYGAATVEAVARAIADADGEDYMEDCRRFDRYARAALTAPLVTADDVALLQDAIRETIRRYPTSPAAAFLVGVSQLQPVTAEDVVWANECLARRAAPAVDHATLKAYEEGQMQGRAEGYARGEDDARAAPNREGA